MELSLRLQVFEGPLDLLLYLIDRNKVNIYDIPIVEITDQYMEYIRMMRQENLDVLSEFLVMAATLVDIKCRMLLPPDPDAGEEEEDPRSELVEQLLEYKMYKYMATELQDMAIDAGRRYFREPSIPEEVRSYEPPVDLTALTRGLDLDRLHAIYEQVLRRREDRQDPVRSRFGSIVKEEVTLEQKMAYMDRYVHTHRTFRFRELLEHQGSRIELIVTFLSVLELMKTGTITIVQENLFDDIMITSQVAEEEEIKEHGTDEPDEQ